MAKTEMTLEKQIKNLQVSISIYRKEIKESLQSLSALQGEDKNKKIARIAVCEKQIAQKEAELAPLKEQWAKDKPARSSKSVSVSDDEIQAVLAKYNIK